MPESSAPTMGAALLPRLQQQADARGLQMAQQLATAAAAVLSGPRSGRVYTRPGGFGTYQASAPGEAPAERTGALRQSWRPFSTVSVTDNAITVTYGIRSEGVPYAGRLDPALPGTVSTPSTGPRPFVAAIQAAAAEPIAALLRQPWGRA